MKNSEKPKVDLQELTDFLDVDYECLKPYVDKNTGQIVNLEVYLTKMKIIMKKMISKTTPFQTI